MVSGSLLQDSVLPPRRPSLSKRSARPKAAAPDVSSNSGCSCATPRRQQHFLLVLYTSYACSLCRPRREAQPTTAPSPTVAAPYSQHFWQRLSRASETANHGRISVLAPYLTFRSCSPSGASRGQRRPERCRPDLPRPTHLESCSGHAATSLRTWLIQLGPVCLAASPLSWIPADLFFIRAIPHHCLLCRVQGLST